MLLRSASANAAIVMWLGICVSIAFVAALAAAAANAALHWRRLRPPAANPAPGTRRVQTPALSTRAFIDEFAATLFAWAGPIAALCPRRRTPPDPDRPAVVLLHEPILAAASWLLVRRLRSEGWRVVTHTTRARPIDDAGIDAVIASIRSRLGQTASAHPIVLVAIGGCGLLARQLAAREHTFARVVTLATPHGGNAAWFAAPSLRPGAAYLEVVAGMDAAPRRFDAVAIYSDGDGWIEPREASYYPGAFNLEVHDLGRMSMLFSRRVFEYLTENLVQPPPRKLG